VNEISIESIRPAGIPALSIRPAGDEPVPLVIFVHGWSNGKEQGAVLGARLAQAGLHYVAFDCWLHGERGDDGSARKRFDRVYPPDSGLDDFEEVLEVATQAARDVEVVIEYFEAQGEIPDGKIGVCGFSMGGFATFLAASKIEKIAAAAAFAAQPAFRRTWDDAVLRVSADERWAEEMAALEAESKARSELLASLDPFERLSGFVPKPLLILNGAEDMGINWIYSLDLYRRLKPLYSDNPERLSLGLPPVEHVLTDDVADRIVEWFARFLA
jgi:dienelactone hydrolase